MDDNPEDCLVCFTTYDCTSRRPRNLPCGHSLCTPCIDRIEQQGVVTCPTCRGRHTVPEAGQFPVSYGMEAFVKRVRNLESTCPSPKSAKGTADPTPSPSTGLGTKGAKGLSRAVQSLLQEHDGKIVSAIHASQKAQAKLDQYQRTMADWDEEQQHCKDGLQELIDQIETARELLRQEQSKAFEKKQQLYQLEQQLHALLQTVRTAATREEAYEVIDDAEHSLDEEKQREEECVAMFPDVPTVTTITKMKEVVAATPPWRVFLQVAWPGKAPRRVIVHVPRSRQFLLLCTGQKGPCYSHTILWGMGNKGRPGERVYGGDYEHNDGSGGAALLLRPDEVRAEVPCRAGQVWRWGGNNPAEGAQFAIITKDRPGACLSRVLFGQVEEGLQVMQEAGQHHTITQVTVEDCGVVLWGQ